MFQIDRLNLKCGNFKKNRLTKIFIKAALSVLKIIEDPLEFPDIK